MAEPYRPDYPANEYRVDPIYLRMTLPRNTSDGRGSLPSVQDLFGELSVTSQFKVTLFFGDTVSTSDSDRDINAWLVSCGVLGSDLQSLRYEFMCHNTSLPGSSLSMLEETGSRQGITERFPIIRQFGDITMDFYVDAEYGIIRLFDEWINFINPLYTDSGRAETGSFRGSTSSRSSLDDNNFYRMRYPDTYKRNISITKFERDFKFQNGVTTETPSMITYKLINAFPTNMTALPLSYEGSTITKTSVSFMYDRYVVQKHWGIGNSEYSDLVNSSGNSILFAQPQQVTSGSPNGLNQDPSRNNIPRV
jgi:hypothetical protein